MTLHVAYVAQMVYFIPEVLFDINIAHLVSVDTCNRLPRSV